MALDFDSRTSIEPNPIDPMEIAHSELFTAREKIELLHRLKEEINSIEEEAYDLAFSPEEIDEAIHEVKLGAATGEGTASFQLGD